MNNSAPAQNIFAPGRKYDFKVVWKRALGSGYSGISILGDLGVTMSSDSAFDFVHAFDPDDGHELWRFKIDSTYLGRFGSQNGPISTPAIAGDRVYALGPRGQLLALQGKPDKNSGSPICRRNIPRSRRFTDSPPRPSFTMTFSSLKPAGRKKTPLPALTKTPAGLCGPRALTQSSINLPCCLH